MNRRTVLKAGLALAATSHTAVASGDALTPDQTIGTMIDRHTILCAERKVLWDFVDDACDSAECPPFAKIKMSELGNDHRGCGAESKTLHWAADIDADIDRKIGLAKWHVDNGISASFHQARIDRLEVDRGKAHAILEGRAKVYKDWRKASGVDAADCESERLGEIIEGLERSIIDWEARSLHEALLKAEWVTANWIGLGDTLRLEAVRQMVTGRVAA